MLPSGVKWLDNIGSCKFFDSGVISFIQSCLFSRNRQSLFPRTLLSVKKQKYVSLLPVLSLFPVSLSSSCPTQKAREREHGMLARKIQAKDPSTENVVKDMAYHIQCMLPDHKACQEIGWS